MPSSAGLRSLPLQFRIQAWILSVFSLLFHVLDRWEILAIGPIRILRRSVPSIGGILVILLCGVGVGLRMWLDLIQRVILRRPDPRWIYVHFWNAIRAEYVHIRSRTEAWTTAFALFGSPLGASTSSTDLWIAIQESIALCEDPGICVVRPGSRGSRMSRGVDELDPVPDPDHWNRIRKFHLHQGGHVLTRRILYGILNAETSPGWTIAYISLDAFSGFVDAPWTRVDIVNPMWTPLDPLDPRSGSLGRKGLKTVDDPEARTGFRIPDAFEREALRWALDGVLQELTQEPIDGLVLDLRKTSTSTQDSLDVALLAAGFFVPSDSKSKSCGLTVQCKRSDPDPTKFSKPKTYLIKPSGSGRCSRPSCYQGPLAILQDRHTSGTAELLLLALLDRPNVCRIGETTAGHLAPCKHTRLPNGWMLRIPNTRCYNLNGEEFDDRGIPPDVVVNPNEANSGVASSATSDEYLQHAVEFIMQH